MDKQEAITQGLNLVENSEYCFLGTIREDGFPNIKGINNLKHEGLKKFWFSTNTSSKRVQQLRKNKRACVYYVDGMDYKGLMLTGTMEVLQDIASRKLLWFYGAEKYYPLGLEDPGYCVLRFTATEVNYYHALENISFEIE
ncbi:pyridoxamine 5'-phosphate oxidase family protein [Chloroflexota bacterium]